MTAPAVNTADRHPAISIHMLSILETPKAGRLKAPAVMKQRNMSSAVQIMTFFRDKANAACFIFSRLLYTLVTSVIS